MRRVPYCFIGNGRLAKHLIHYCDLLGVAYVHWHRSLPDAELHCAIAGAETIVLLTSDSSLSQISQEVLPHLDSNQLCVHCSGSLSIPGVISAHPLMTFGQTLYSLETYQALTWIVEDSAPESLMVELIHERYPLKVQDKTLYHAWCVLAGNGTSVLWQKFSQVLEEELSLPSSVADLYAKQALAAGLGRDVSLLSGPIVRGDASTIDQHQQCFKDRVEKKVYDGLIDLTKELVT